MKDFLDSLDFLADDKKEKHNSKTIEILIVDDNEDVHKITELILMDFNYKNYAFTVSHAYSGEEVKEIMKHNSKIAVILLDVVMETDTAGLDAVKYIREELKNDFVRIILRTGQPGKAPEDEVIKNYDINNYIAKTEGSVQKIYTALYTAIRAYNDLVKLYYSKIGLEKVVASSKKTYEYDSIVKFYEGVLFQLSKLLEFDDNAFIASENYKKDAAIIDFQDNHEHILAGIGRFGNNSSINFEDVFSEEQIIQIRNQKPNKLKFYDEYYIGCWVIKEANIRNYIYFETNRELNETDKKLIKLVINNFSLALNNFSLNELMRETQLEMIFKLGDVIETRLRDNHNHIYRVSEISAIIAKEYGFSNKEIELIKICSTLHDIGKISINDEILLKPGKLTAEEFETVKNHSSYGYNMLVNSEKSENYECVFTVAAEIAHHHHEKWNGEGYPDGLSGTDISKYSRIVSVADVFDALSHSRCYKEAWSIERIKAHMIGEKGKSFEPEIVDLLLKNMESVLKILEKYPE